MEQLLARGRAATPVCAGIVPLRPRVRPPPSVTPIRALYDGPGRGPSWLARALAGRRITCSGLLGPVPSGAEGWHALGENPVLPCPACGGDHAWPVGVLVVHAPGIVPPGAPFAAATVQGVLDPDPGADAPAGTQGRLILRDATALA